MNEIRRMVYLKALGVDAYVSRSQLPGAAPTQRLRVVPKALPLSSAEQAGTEIPTELTSLSPSDSRSNTAPARVAPSMPSVGAGRSAQQPAIAIQPATPSSQTPERFCLAAIVAGGWLWLEELPDFVVSREQVQLIHAMSIALAHVVGKPGAISTAAPDVAQFDWPVHTNQQLDLGPQAARAALAGFVGRRIDQQRCQGIILLGNDCQNRATVDLLDEVPIVATAGTFEMFSDHSLKQQAWRDLRRLAAGN